MAITGTSRNVLIVALIAVIVLSIGMIFWSGNQKPQSEGALIFSGVLETAASETARLVGKHGKVIVVTATCARCQSSEPLFRLLTGKHGMQIVARAEIPITPDMQVTLPLSKYRELVEAHPDADAIVSLAGLPVPLPENLQAPHPKLIVLRNGNPTEVKPLLENGFVDVAIVPRQLVKYDKKHLPKTPHEWFDSQFQVVTPTTISTAFQ